MGKADATPPLGPVMEGYSYLQERIKGYATPDKGHGRLAEEADGTASPPPKARSGDLKRSAEASHDNER